MKTFFDWLGPIATASMVAAIVSSAIALFGHLLTWKQRKRELQDTLKRHSEQQEQAFRQHREKLEADSAAQKTNLENAWNLHREKIEAELRKEDVSRKMQLRREAVTDGATAISKAAFWLESLADLTSEPDFKSQVLQEFGLAIGKLIIIGNERTVAAVYAVLDRWRGMMQAAIDARFSHDAAKLPVARRAFAETNLQLILALRAELDLTIDEEWFRKTALAAVEEQMAQSTVWLEQVRQRTDGQ